MSVRMVDIAKAANTSVATVGRVIHNNGYVSADVRERIEKAIRDLGYVPNQSARALKSNRSGIIGILAMQNPNGLYYRIIDSILCAAHANGFECVTMEIPRVSGDVGRVVQSFIGLHVDGIVTVSTTLLAPEMFTQLDKSGIPVVAVERCYFDQPIDNLVVEDFEAARDAVNRIAAKGHRRIAIIASGPGADVEKQRLAGYKQAMADLSHIVDEDLICLTNGYDPVQGREAAEQLLALPEPPTAIFTTADTLAAGVLQALYAQKLRIPEDVSLVGYDNVLSQSLSPQIDSVGLLLNDTGAQVIELLMKRMAEPGRAPEVRPIHTAYMDRGSVKTIYE